MTAKQKAARMKFKKVVAEASKLRKKNPKLTQAQAVKQAWAIQYSKEGKSKPKKVAAIKIIEKGESKKAKPKATYQQVRTKKGTYKGLKKVSGNDETEKIIKKAHESITRIKGKNYSPTSYEIQKWIDENINVKKKLGAASSKVKAKKGKSTEMHTDTKSHNVNIRVVSGFVGRLIIKTFTLSELKKMNPIYFEKGKDKFSGTYKRKLIVSKKLESQVMVEAQKSPINNERSYVVRLINPNGSISIGKRFDTIFGAADYIGKNIIF